MHETLLTSGVSEGKEYPDSGPGIKTLKHGDETLGYFGTLTESEMFSTTELRNYFGFYDGIDTAGGSSTWVKMFVDSKVIYFPTQTLATAVSWNQLYDKGLIYGTDDNGLFPATVPVNQGGLIRKGPYQLRVRVFKTTNPDPVAWNVLQAIATSDPLKSTEWGRVISAICDPRQQGYTGNNWALFKVAQYFLPSSYFAIGQGTRTSPQTDAFDLNNIQIGPYPKATANMAWFPALEYVPGVTIYTPVIKTRGIAPEPFAPVKYKETGYENSYLYIKQTYARPITPNLVITKEPSTEMDYYKIFTNTFHTKLSPTLPVTTLPFTYE